MVIVDGDAPAVEGVLVEVPVMLLVVAIVTRTRGWYEKGANCLTRIRELTDPDHLLVPCHATF